MGNKVPFKSLQTFDDPTVNRLQDNVEDAVNRLGVAKQDNIDVGTVFPVNPGVNTLFLNTASGNFFRWTGTVWAVASSGIAGSSVAGTGTVNAAATPLFLSGGGATVNIQLASGAQAGYLSAADWTTFNNKGSGTVSTATLPLSIVGADVRMSQAATAANGWLSSTDWNTFNNKGAGVVATAAAPMFILGTNLLMSEATTTTSGWLSYQDWNTFNQAAVSGVFTATLPASVSAHNLSMTQATTSTSGWLSATDWNTFNNKGGGISTASPPMSVVGSNLIMSEATTTTSGWLSYQDWNTFNQIATSGVRLANSPLTIAGNTMSFDQTANFFWTGLQRHGQGASFQGNASANVPVQVSGFSAAATANLFEAYQYFNGPRSFSVSPYVTTVSGQLTVNSGALIGVPNGGIATVPLTVNGFSNSQTGRFVDVFTAPAGSGVFRAAPSPAATPTGFTGQVSLAHLTGGSNAITGTIGIGAGTTSVGTALTASGHDLASRVGVTVNSTGTVSKAIIQAAFANKYSSAPFLTMSPGNAATAAIAVASAPFIVSTVSGFSIIGNTTGIPTGTYVWYVSGVIQ